MGQPVVIVESGGLPVTVVETGGFPMEEAENGFGLPVTVVESGGLPVVGIANDPLPTIQLSASSLAENSAEGTAVGTLSVSNGSGTYTFSLTDSASSRFKVAGTNGVNLQAGSVATNYESATSHSITVQADNGVDTPITRTFSITITDVNEGPGVPGTPTNQSTNTDVTPTIRVPLNTAGGFLSHIAGDVIRLYRDGVSVATATLISGDVSAGYVEFTSAQLYGVSHSFTARAERSGQPNSAQSSALTVTFDYLGFIFYGQSNALNHMSTASSPPSASEGTAVWDNTNSVWAAPPAANGVRELLNELKSLTGKPVRLVYGGQAGVPIEWLMSGSPSSTAFADLSSRITASAIVASFVLWHQGEGNTSTSQASYHSSLSTLHQSICDLMSRTKSQCKLVLSSLATTDGIADYGPDSGWSTMQGTLYAAEGALSNVYYSHSNVDATLVDSVHWNAASYGRSGKRYAQTVAYIRGDVATRPQWFATAAARVDTTHTDITVVHGMGSDFTPTSGITGFEVSNDNGANWETPSAAVRQGATTIRLTHSDLGTGERLVRYQYGHTPTISSPVVDNGTLSAPLNYTTSNLVAAGAVSLPVPTFDERKNSTGSGAVYTASGFSFGTRTEEVMVVAAISAASGNTNITGAKLKRSGESDINATIVQLGVGSGGSSRNCHLVQFILPAGSDSMDIEVTYASSIFNNPSIALWWVETSHLSSTTKVDSDTAQGTSGTGGSIDISSSSSGMIIAAGMSRQVSGSATITGDESYAERYDTVTLGGDHIGADASGTASGTNDNTVTFTWSSANDWVAVAASWR